MSRSSRPGTPWREHGVLLLGVVSSAVLVVAAFIPANDPETLARTELAQLAARTEQAVVDGWERSLREPAAIAQACSPTIESSGVPPFASEPSTTDDVPDDAAADALIAEAERLEWNTEKSEDPTALAREALARKCSTSQRVRARALLFRDALRRGATDVALESFRALQPDLERRDARVAKLGLACLLAAKPLAEEPDGPRAAEFLRALDVRGLLAEHPVRFERSELPAAWYWPRGIEALAAVAAASKELPLGESSHAVQRFLLERALTGAVESYLGPGKLTEPSTTWELLPTEPDFFVRRGTENGAWIGFFATRADLGAALVERLTDAALLPEGMELDFEGDRADLGVELRPRVELHAPAFAFTLRHRDPEELVRSHSRRQTWLRAALFVMAAFAAGAGVAMARALRRERKLAEAKATFIANVSHELRTPLASILLMAENLEAGRTRDAESAKRYHGLIRREARRLARLVDDVLDFSRLERGRRLEVRREDVDPRAAVDEWTTDFRAWAAEHAFELDVAVGELPKSAALDREALRRALLNLLDNARKHSGSKRARFEARSAAGALLLCVSDDGVGIPPAKRASVFEPFERLREGQDAAPGTGLGLAIVREIVIAHGGTIAIRDSEHGKGAVFELVIPCDSEGVEIE